MLNFRKTAGVAATVLLFGAGACADLEVTNSNNPDAGRALASAGDVESLISGAYSSWWVGQHAYEGPELALTRMSFEATAPWNNAGMVPLSTIPRNPLVNAPNDPYYINQSLTWTNSYRALAAIAQGIKALEENPELDEELGDTAALRIRAFGKFVQGLGHAAIAVLYDQGFVVDETVDLATVELVGYQDLMTAAMGYFDEALALAAQMPFDLDDQWMSVAVSRDELVKMIHAYKARYLANVARTPEERAAVNWNQVIAEATAAEGFSWHYDMTYAWQNWESDIATGYALTETWNQLNYFISGMADQSGSYQRWLQVPIGARTPLLPDGPDADAEADPFLIITPDQRFAQGTTLAEQAENPGTLWARHVPGQNWARPERGQWRWSYYRTIKGDSSYYSMGGASDLWMEIGADEMRMLKAEGLLRTGQAQAAAELVNVTRVAAGLNPTNAAGLNTSCVPKLPDGSCGDLMEMIKWEMRMESYAVGPMGAPWYFNGRGWDDLIKGTVLQFPVPARELTLLGLPSYTFGGVGGESASNGSKYNFPGVD